MVVSPEGSFAICGGIAIYLRAFRVVVGLVGWLCYKSRIDVPQQGCIKLPGVMLPFISLGGVISPMKMIVPRVSNKPLPSAQLTTLQYIQIFLKLMLDNRLPHDLVVQLQEQLEIQRGSLRLQAAAEGVASVWHGQLILVGLRIGEEIAIGLILGLHDYIKLYIWSMSFLIMMRNIIILILLIQLVRCPCASQCGTCKLNDNPYSCTSCLPDNRNIFIFSCPSPQDQLAPFIAIAAVITALHLFMLAMGQGVYRDIFENIQLTSLVTWRYGFQRGALALQGTNLAIVKNNSFPDTFGSQFIIVMILLGIFWMLLILSYRIPHNPTAILIRRKKIIFPTRIITFVFNILLFSSLIQVSTISTEPSLKVFALVLAILAIIKIVVVLIGLAVTSNWKRFQVDDPHYYVLLQQMTSKKWYAKNNVLISLIARGIIIIAFVLQFQTPQIAGIIMVITQILYTFYVVALLRFTKIRYYVCIVLGNMMTIGLLLVVYIGSLSSISGDSWTRQSLGYIILELLLACLFFFATTSEIIIKKQIISKQLRSMYLRYIKCQKLDEQVVNNKYDDNSNRERVTLFHTNLLYQRDIKQNQLEMSNRSNA